MRRALILALAGLLAAATPAGADRLVTIDPDRGTRTTVAKTRTYGWVGTPCWAADGALVVRAEATGTGRADRYVAYGPRTRTLERAPVDLLEAVFAPGCTRVAEVVYGFEDDRRNRGGVQLRDVGGSPAARIFSPDFPDGPQLAWSRRGDRLALVDFERRGQTLRVVDAGGRVLTRRPTLFPGLSREPFSPDGGSLAYVDRRTASGRDRLFVLDVATGARRAIAVGASDLRGAAWSPDGARIALAAYSNRAGHVLVTVDVATGAVETRRVGDLLESVSWSPDGTRLLAVFTTGEERHGIALLGVDPLTPMKRLLTVREYFPDPSWSPDGTRIATVIDGR